MTQSHRKFVIEEPSKMPEFKPISFMRRGHSTTRSVLYYLKMKRGMPLTVKQVIELFPRFFKHPYQAGRILKTLERRGFAESVYPGAWRITAMGLKAVDLLAQRDKNKFVELEPYDF
jgi:hypothetical protein